MPVVRNVVTNAAAQNYAMQSIVLGIVRSVPFQMRTTMRAPAAAGDDQGSQGVIDDCHEEALTAADVPPRGDGDDARDAVPRRDGAGTLGAIEGAADALWGDLHPERHLPAAVAPGDGRQQFRIQAGDAATRSLSQPPRDHQRHEGARRQPGHGRRAHGGQRRVAQWHGSRHGDGEVRRAVAEVHRPVHRRQDCRGHAVAVARSGHRGHGHIGWRMRRLSVRVLQRHLVARRQEPAACCRQSRARRSSACSERADRRASAWRTCAGNRACSTRWPRRRVGCGARSGQPTTRSSRST